MDQPTLKTSLSLTILAAALQGCTAPSSSATSSSPIAESCGPLRDSAPITLAVEADDGLNRILKDEHAVFVNPQPGLDPTQMHWEAGTLKFTLQPIEACNWGLRTRYLNQQVSVVVALPWKQVITINDPSKPKQLINVIATRPER